MSYKKLGDIVKFISNKNVDGIATILYGINIDKYFMPSVANTIGVDLKKYKVVVKNQFACNRMHVGRDKRLPISMSTFDYPFIVSPAYDVFEVTDENVIPEYLMLWFRRSEFDRQCWFYTDADVRGGLSLDALKSIEIRIPSIEKQRDIVAQYQAIENKIKVNEQICEKLEATAQALYKHWFVDFEFPNSPPLEGCPQDGVVNSHSLEGCPQDGVVNSHSLEGCPQDGVVISRNTQNYMALPYNPALKDRAKALRKAGNLAEVLFWQQVRNKQFKGLDFDRQKIVGNYIVDFYNANYQVVIEIDGSSHDEKEEYDAKRQAYLESLGLTVLHFTDLEVKKHMDSVMRYMEDFFEKQKKNQQGILSEKEKNHPAFQAPLQRRGILGYKSSGGTMVFNQELEKEIPEGWEVGTLEYYTEFKNGYAFKSDWWETQGLPVIKIGSIQNGIIQGNELGYVSHKNKSSNANTAKIGDIVIAMTGATVGKIGIVIGNYEEYYINQRVGVFSFRNEYYKSYIYIFLKQDFFNYEIQNIGGDSAQANVSDKQILNVSIMKPIDCVVKEFNKKFEKQYKLIISLNTQNQKLIQLQSLLLSRLATLEG